MDRPSELSAESTAGWWRSQVVLPAFIPLALLGGFLPSFSLTANLYVLLLGGAFMVAGLSRRLPRRGAPLLLGEGAIWWLLPVGIFVIVELVTFVKGGTYAYPTLSLLLDPPLDDYPVRALAYFGWLTGFWALVRR